MFPVVYQRATGPTGGPAPGALALRDWALTRFPDTARDLGVYNPRRIRGGRGWSVHAEGRALDVGFPVERFGHPDGHALTRLLVSRHAQLGVQQVIWSRSVWRNTIGRWRPYNGTSPHLDHAHIELTREAGAQLTPAMIADTLEEPDMIVRIITAYLDGGREPAADEVHAWAVDITRKLGAGQPVEPTLAWITWAVRNEQ